MGYERSPVSHEAFEEALDDLHRAAQLLEEMADDMIANGGDDSPNVAHDAERFVQHIRTAWNR